MKKILVFSFLMVTMLTVCAQAISEQEAKERAAAFLMSTTGGMRRAMAQSQMEAATVAVDNIYAFNLRGGGFVIASGDERALPVLGYSTSGRIAWDNMPENMRWWLQGYGEAIRNLGTEQLAVRTERRATRAKIEPLVKTTWDQSPCYNLDCPLYDGRVTTENGKLCQTGCVATAMAQVMNYHRWPQGATTEIPAYTYMVSNIKDGVRETFNLGALPPTTFEWSRMADCYLDESGELLDGITEQQIRAVANLMRYCGQAVQMAYSPNISLAYDAMMNAALINYFGYDKGARCVRRIDYGIDEWETLIYNELASQRPVIYGGDSDDGGHSFVCDGYDENGLFHINWGWGGYADNYFALSVLNSNATGVSGVAKPGIGFSIGQDAVIGVQRPADGSAAASLLPQLSLINNYTVAAEKGECAIYVAYEYANLIYPTATFLLQLFVDKGDGTWEQITNEKSFDEKISGVGSYGFLMPNFDSSIPDGTVRIYARAKCTSVEGCDWQLLGSKRNYVERTVKSGVITYRAMPSADGLKVTKCEITKGDQVVNTPNDLTLTIDNSGEEYTGELLLTVVSVDNDNIDQAIATVRDQETWPDYYVRLKNTLPVGAYIKGNSTGNKVTFSLMPPYAGNYVLMLSEASSDDRWRNYPFAYFGLTGIKSATGIEKVESTRQDASACYDLQGRRMSSEPAKGIYIRNGRKYVVR